MDVDEVEVDVDLLSWLVEVELLLELEIVDVFMSVLGFLGSLCVSSCARITSTMLWLIGSGIWI